MKKSNPTIFIVDDDPSVRKSLKRLVSSLGCRVECFGTAQEFLKRPVFKGTGCLVLDIKMPGLSGLDLQREMKRRSYILPIIFITGHGDIPSSVRAMKSGAIDFLPKPFKTKDLYEAISRALMKHQQSVAENIQKTKIQERIDSLTPREKDVFLLIIRGFLNKQIAWKLGIAEKTVKLHRHRVMVKMKTQSLAELVHLSGMMKLLPSKRSLY